MLRRPPTAILLRSSDVADIQSAIEARNANSTQNAAGNAGGPTEPNGAAEAKAKDTLMEQEVVERGNRERRTQAERIGV